MKIKKFKNYMCDFETTVYDNQEYTEVWAAAIVELNTEDVKIFHSIKEFFNYVFRSLDGNIALYFHNLKFDGFFILHYLINYLHWQPALTSTSDPEDMTTLEWRQEYRMRSRTFKYMISERGQFYTIILKQGKRFIEIRDSLKLLPFSVKEIGRSFDTKHKKLDIDYKGFRYAGCEITQREKEYIKNDVLVVKEALEIMFSENHTKLTIGACCMDEYKRTISREQYEKWFPLLTDVKLDKETYGAEDADAYIRRSYKGGWCYLVPEKANKIFTDGLTLDVNSLYSYVMSGESGNVYPVGLPEFFTGPEIPAAALAEDTYFFVRVRTRFYLKEKHLPTIQIKNNFLYRSTEWLETSDIKYNNKYYDSYIDLNGEEKPAIVTLTFTQTDYYLFLEHYHVKDFEILDGCYFKTAFGIFDEYITKYKQLKMESTGSRRTLAKLFLNNLYGKMATNKNSSWKYCYIKEDGSLGMLPVAEYKKRVGFIAVGSAITSYARNYTIRAAQQNYNGKYAPGFIYADTDSIHIDLPIEKIKGVSLDKKIFGCWDMERNWKQGIFARQKTYIEIDDDGYNIKCAGLTDHCKELLQYSLTGKCPPEVLDELPENERKFVLQKREIKDFKKGLRIPGKLMPKQIPGGVVLLDTDFTMN